MDCPKKAEDVEKAHCVASDHKKLTQLVANLFTHFTPNVCGCQAVHEGTLIISMSYFSK